MKRGKKFILIFIMLVLLVAIGLFVLTVIAQKSNNSPSNSSLDQILQKSTTNNNDLNNIDLNTTFPDSDFAKEAQ